MVKLILTACAVLLVAGFGLPPAFGVVAERGVIRLLESLPDDPVWDVSLESYERGLYSSTATIQISSDEAYLDGMSGLLDDAESLELFDKLADGLRVNLTVNHGPLGVTSEPFLGWSRVVAEIDPDSPLTEGLTESLGIPYLMQLTTVSDFGGKTIFAGDVPPIKVAEAESVIDFSGMQVTGSFSANDDRFVYELIIDSIAGGSPAADYSIEGIRSSADNVFITDDLATGKTDIAIDRAAVGSAAMPGSEVVLQDMSIAMDAAVDAGGERISADIIYLLDAVTFPPAAQVQQLRMVIKLGDIDVAAAQAYLDLIQTMDPQDQESIEVLPDAMADALYGILRGSPAFALDTLSFLYNDESFAGSVALKVLGERLPEDSGLIRENPAALVDAVGATASLAIDEPLAMAIAQTIIAQQLVQNLPPDADFTQQEIEATAQMQSEVLLQSFVAQSMLIREAGQVRGEFAYADGEFVVNGKPLALDALTGAD